MEGYQYGWRFRYVDNDPATTDPIAYRDLYAPTNTTVLLRITSKDVNHAWWIPRLGGKFDAVKGYHIWTWFRSPASSMARSSRASALSSADATTPT